MMALSPFPGIQSPSVKMPVMKQEIRKALYLPILSLAIPDRRRPKKLDDNEQEN